MFGWLAKKGQDARVTMCIKEVKWELENGSRTKRATILALAQLLRGSFFGEDMLPPEAISHPLNYERTDLMTMYEVLESVRNKQRLTTANTRRNERALFGRDLPQFSLDHAKAVERGTEVWMCTIGAGIVTGRQEDVRTIWAHLASSIDAVGDAIQQLRQVGARLGQIYREEGADDLFSRVGTTEWTKLCQFAPRLM